MTRPDHANGTSRIHEAVEAIGGEAEIVVNFQGDIPTVSRETVRAALVPLADPAVDIATIATEIRREEERDDADRRRDRHQQAVAIDADADLVA